MVRTEDREKARVLWASFGEPIDYEGHFASVEQMKNADFPIYVVEQKIGDFVMVPSMSYHQVVNLVMLPCIFCLNSKGSQLG
jgi:hypothetical protein